MMRITDCYPIKGRGILICVEKLQEGLKADDWISDAHGHSWKVVAIEPRKGTAAGILVGDEAPVGATHVYKLAPDMTIKLPPEAVRSKEAAPTGLSVIDPILEPAVVMPAYQATTEFPCLDCGTPLAKNELGQVRSRLDGAYHGTRECIDSLRTQLAKAQEPIPMTLWCPGCGTRHLDIGEFATKAHHTHACQTCGMVWRPAIVPTVGVQYLPGFKNEPPVGKGPPGRKP